MNKLSKIFLVIIIILVIALITSLYFLRTWFNHYLYVAEDSYFQLKAIEDEHLRLQMQEDGTYKLVDKDTPSTDSELEYSKKYYELRYK